MTWGWPDNFKTVPLLVKVDGKTCHFKDGSTAEVDAIILCTGWARASTLRRAAPLLPWRPRVLRPCDMEYVMLHLIFSLPHA